MENVDVRLVDVQMLVNVSREMVNGAYIALSEDAYIRRVDDAHVYFTLQRMVMPGNSKSKADWRLEGFQCDDVDGGAGVCVKFAAVDLGELEVQHPDDEEKLQYVFRQNAVKHRHLQFESDDKLNEAIVGAYYDCALAGGDNWCCNTSLADADTAASGPTCWYLPPDPDISKDCWLDSRWDGTFVCCGNSGCLQVIEGPVPTNSPTDSSATASPSPAKASFSPESPPPFQIITAPPGTPHPTPIPFEDLTTDPPTQAPTTASPTEAPTTAPPTEAPTTAPPTSPPTTTYPPTSAPTTAATTQSPSSTPPTQAPTTAPTQAPNTSPPTQALTDVSTTAPASNSPTTAPIQAPTAISIATMIPISTQAPTSLPTWAPTTAPATIAPVSTTPTTEPVAAPTTDLTQGSTPAPVTTNPTTEPTAAPTLRKRCLSF